MANFKVYEDEDDNQLRCFANKKENVSIIINDSQIISLTRDDVIELINDLKDLLNVID